MLLPQARQERATDSHCLKLPETFPTPRFSFGDWVKTDDDDVGMIVGMTLYRLGSHTWWEYQFDMTVDSPNFWEYQGCEGNIDSPACLMLFEENLTLFPATGEG